MILKKLYIKWKLYNQHQMKKALKIIGIILLVIILIVAGILIFINSKGVPTYEVNLPNVEIPPADSATLEHGRNLTVMICAGCHTNEEGKYAGRQLVDIPSSFGTIYTQNITKHPTKGIGQYTDAELMYFLRTGIMRDGRYSFIMSGFPLMSDHDMKSIISFLRSDHPLTAPIDQSQPRSKPSLLTKILTNTVMKPLPYPEDKIIAPDPRDKESYGEYLTNGMLGCFHCHSASFPTNNAMKPELSKGFYGGGNNIIDPETLEVVLSANLTSDESGLKDWTEQEFGEAVRFGKAKGGGALKKAMPPHPNLTDEQVSAMWAYVKTIPPIQNVIPVSE